MNMRALVLALLLAACHPPRPTPPVPPRETRIEMEPMTFVAGHQPSGEPVVELVDAQTIFERAGTLFGNNDFAGALALYDKILAEHADSQLVVPSLYNSGLCHERLGDLLSAVERYKKLIAHGGATNDLLDAEFRLAATLLALKNWPAAVEAYARLARHSGPCDEKQKCDLTLTDRLEILAQRGRAQFEMRDLVAAERTLREQQDLYTKYKEIERPDTDFFVGQGAYYLAQIAHERYRALPIRLPEKVMADDLEQKGRALLVAQHRYVDAMRVNNGEWATAAGYQIAVLYRQLYDDIIGAPIPPQLSPEAKDIYKEELKKTIANLLRKAAAVHERNVLMAERIGVKNDWVRRSNEEMDHLRQLLIDIRPVAQPPAPTAPPPPEAPPSRSGTHSAPPIL
jgi:tetratricopeptide (TPR) repeat protein